MNVVAIAMQKRKTIATANPEAKIASEDRTRCRGSNNVANVQLVSGTNEDRSGNQSKLAWQRNARTFKEDKQKDCNVTEAHHQVGDDVPEDRAVHFGVLPGVVLV